MAQSVGMFQRPVEYRVKELFHEVVVLNIDYESKDAAGYTSSSAGKPITLRCGENTPPISGPSLHIYNVTIKNTKINGTVVMWGRVISLNDGFWKLNFGVYTKNRRFIEEFSYQTVAEAFSCNMVQPFAFMDSVRQQSGKLNPTDTDYINAENNLKSYFMSMNKKLIVDKYIPIKWL